MKRLLSLCAAVFVIFTPGRANAAACPMQINDLRKIGLTSSPNDAVYLAEVSVTDNQQYAARIKLRDEKSQSELELVIPKFLPLGGKGGYAAFVWHKTSALSASMIEASSGFVGPGAETIGTTVACGGEAAVPADLVTDDTLPTITGDWIATPTKSTITANMYEFVPAKFTRHPSPDYAELAKIENEQGTVIVTLTVASNGSAKNVRITKSSGFELLDQAALTAARHSEFRPAMLSGTPVEDVDKIVYTFTLGS